MFEVKADAAKNRLYIVLKGFMHDEEAKVAADDVINNVNKLRTGFDVINDISEMKVASQNGVKEITRAQQYIAQKGVRRVVRVVNNSITQIQFNRTGKAAGYQAEANTAATVEEAETMLDTPNA